MVSLKVAVTGANGFIASALCRYLGEQGHDVLGLARSAERAALLAQEGIAAGVADVTDRRALDRALAAYDAVIHTAALFNGRRPRGTSFTRSTSSARATCSKRRARTG